jgi:hypothetical protein
MAEGTDYAGMEGISTLNCVVDRLFSLRKNAQIAIPQAPFAGGICFFLNIFAKSRSLASLRMTATALFPRTLLPLRHSARREGSCNDPDHRRVAREAIRTEGKVA